jgi:O-antigen/teichoic acid export membrane protein
LVNPSKNAVGQGAAYIYIEAVASIIFGYLFWIIVSKIGSAQIIGTSSAVITIAGIFAYVATIGTDNGILRFLGKSFSEKRLDDTKVFVKASLLLVSAGTLGCIVLILGIKEWIYGSFGIDFSLTVLTILIMGSSAIYALFYSVVTASLKTKVLPKTLIISSSIKLALAIILLSIGTGVLGLTISFAVSNFLSCILLGIVILAYFKSPFSQSRISKNKENIDDRNMNIGFFQASRCLLLASIATWIPSLISIIGSQLGTVIVFGSQGAFQSGIYFISFIIVTGITEIMYSLFVIALPVLSAMKHGRRRFAWQTIRLSLIVALPLSSSLVFYSKEIMQLIGREYVEGTLSLQILLLSVFPTGVSAGINALVYSYGNYRQVLAIGLAMNMPRTVLYFILVPTYGSTGAALSYTIGAAAGLGMSIIIAKKIGMAIFWKTLALALAIPLAAGFILQSFEVNYIFAISCTLLVSYVMLFKLKVITKPDLQVFLSLLPYGVSDSIIRLYRKIGKRG